jgi:hypothetical protein
MMEKEIKALEMVLGMILTLLSCWQVWAMKLCIVLLLILFLLPCLYLLLLLFLPVRFRVRPVGIPVVEEERKGGRDEIGQNSGLCEHL